MEEQLNNELAQIMLAELNEFRTSLLAKPPEEILNNAWKYTAMEDIVDALDSWELTEEQARALLKSPSPLTEVTEEYRDQEVDNERIIDAFEEVAKHHTELPIYRHTFQYAMEHGERDAYFASQKAYENCRAVIDKAINSHFDGMYLGKDCVAEVMEQFGPERVKDVLACTIQKKEWDERFSRSNREWAMKVDISHMGKEPYPFMCESHPAVLDGFISMFRREILEQKRDKKAAPLAQHKPRERSDDFEL